MFTLKKLWNALNHAGKPWQISLAVALAMIVGLTPFISLHNIIIILLVLVFNIHLGIFILSSGFFSGVAYIFDPLFHSLGVTILTNESLKPLWTTLYNNPVFNLSHFNNTILMGSLAVSIVLFFPVLKLVSTLLVKYREVIAVKIQNIPILNKLSYFHNEEPSNVKSFRMAGVAVIAVVLIPIYVLSSFYLDGFVKEQLELNIAKNSDKTVAIEDVNVGILSSSVTASGLIISDKNKKEQNIAVDKVSIDIDILSLVMKKFIIDDLSIININFPDHVKQAVTKPEQKSKKTSTDSKFKFDVAQLSKIDTSKIKNIQKDQVKEYYDKFKEYYKKLKPLFNKAAASKEQSGEIVYKRGVGSFITYKDNTNFPQVLVKKGAFSITFEDVVYNGSLKDFTTNQTKYQKPFLFNIISKNEKFKELKVNASIYQVKNKEKNTINLKMSEFKPGNYTSSDFSLQNSVVNGILAINIGKNDTVKGTGKLDIATTDIFLKESNKYITELNKSLKNTKGISASMDIKGSLENPAIKVDSNIEKILKSKINDLVKSQKENLKKEAKSKAKEKLKEKLGDKLDSKTGDTIKGLFNF
jgi:uncharacterized protein (TIGR03546 family)